MRHIVERCVAEQVLDSLCRLESPDDLVNFFEAAAALLNRFRRGAERFAELQVILRFNIALILNYR